MATDVDVMDGVRLLARGVAIELKDGPHRLVFDYESLEFLEEEFQGLDVFMASLRETRYKAKRLRNIRLGITAGLFHERSEHQDLEEFKAEMIGKLDFRDAVDYVDALVLAIMEAFPAGGVPKAPGRRRSPGNGSTTSRQSGSPAPTGNSGG